MRVDELMNSPVLTCRANESLEQAARKMWDHDCGAIPIVNDEDKLVGMLTDRDICMGALMMGRALSDIPIHVAMSKAVFAVTREVSVDEVEQLMIDQQVRRIPVVDPANRPVGIVSLNDLARASVPPAWRIASGRVVQTLAAVSQHRPGIDHAA